MNRKIIGYKYPYETIGGCKEVDRCIKKILGNYYIDYKDKSNNSISQYIPKEIAESFEPIYEEIIFDSFDDIIRKFKGDLVMINKIIVATPKEVLDGSNGKREVLNIIINKQNYQFTPQFELRLKELGISI